jgi:hypothetical protein
VIKTLVSIEVDLTSSLALRFACQLGSFMNMDIQPVYVKESSPHESVMGAGWASRTWEKEMVQQGKAEISDFIDAEKDFCPLLRQPLVIYGDREAELFKLSQTEKFDLYLEGVHFPWTINEIYKRLHTKIYQRIASPMVLVRTFRKVNQVQLLCLDVPGTRTLTEVFQRIWKNCQIPLLLSHASGESNDNGDYQLREAVEHSREALLESGCTVSVTDKLASIPTDEAGETLKDQGLVAIAMERGVRKECTELQWLSMVRTSALIALH